jgi:hypothetical protein
MANTRQAAMPTMRSWGVAKLPRQACCFPSGNRLKEGLVVAFSPRVCGVGVAFRLPLESGKAAALPARLSVNRYVESGSE